jgi:hypothetical protein
MFELRSEHFCGKHPSELLMTDFAVVDVASQPPVIDLRVVSEACQKAACAVFAFERDLIAADLQCCAPFSFFVLKMIEQIETLFACDLLACVFHDDVMCVDV